MALMDKLLISGWIPLDSESYPIYAPIPHRPQVPQIVKNQFIYVKSYSVHEVLKLNCTVCSQFLQFLRQSGIHGKSFELFQNSKKIKVHS